MNDSSLIPDELELTDSAPLEALYDPLRYRLFRALATPRSVPELAAEVGLPANGLYYHVRRLVDAGLVRRVGVRDGDRRAERVYGWAARRIRFAGGIGPLADGPLRGIAAELEAGLADAAAEDAPALLSYHVVALTYARARELEERLAALVAEYESHPSAEPDARRYGVLGVLAPVERSP